MIQGVSYPPTIVNGTLALSQNEDLLAEAILSVLETRPTERIERPEYGSPDFVFESISTPLSIFGRMEAAIVDQVEGITNVTVDGTESEAGVVDAAIRYDIDQTQKEIYLRLSK